MRKFFFSFFILLLLVVPVILFGQTMKSADSLKEKIPVPINLINANNELSQTQEKLEKIARNLKNQGNNINIDSVISNYSSYLNLEAKEIDEIKSLSISKFYLESASRTWKEYQLHINDALKEIGIEVSACQKNLNNLVFEQDVWRLTLKEFLIKADVPNELITRINKIINRISKLKRDYEAKQKEFILKEKRLTDLLDLTNQVLDKIQLLKKQQRTRLFIASGKPFWEISLNHNDIFPIISHLKKVWVINKKSVYNYFSQKSFFWIGFFLLVIALFFLFLKIRYNRLRYDESHPGFVNANFILNIKFIPSLLLILLSYIIIFEQTIPLSLSAIITVALLVLTAMLISRFAGEKGKVQSIAILTLFVINEIEIVFWYFGDLLWYYIVAESVVGIVLIYFFIGFKWKKQVNENPPFVQTMVSVSRFMAGFLAISIFANLFGYVNLAALLTKIAAKIPSILLIIYLLYRILELSITAGCEIGRAFKWSAARYCVNIENGLIKILKLTALFLLVELTLVTIEIYQPVADWFEEALVYDIAIGNISISLGRVLGMILIIAVSYFIANIFKILFGNSALINRNFSKGFLFAINKTAGYIVIAIGFIFGFAYAGIDLGKFSLLAGALGVGIGFGLQNIVNNFISGLILLYERPVEVGDIISVGELTGEVKSIGVRASKIRAFNGFDVVVPNGNIISNDLINWTLEDKKRRLEIKLGVNYGTNPNKVLKILQKEAVNIDKVLVDPAPVALFEGFGDSSLNFRLLVWVHFNDSLTTKSELSIAIYDALMGAGIGIPFPQMDVHIKDGHFTEQPEVIMPKAPDNSSAVTNDNDE